LGRYFAVVTCRNSESTIEKALTSLKEQILRPDFVIVIDDGSTDNTPLILENLKKAWHNLHIIRNPNLGYDIKRVVRNWNSALAFIKENGLKPTDYHLIATDDTVYPTDYALKIISHMDSNHTLAVVSGNYTTLKPEMPHGAGRFVRNSFLKKTQWAGYYPEQMGYESAILYEADYLGYTYSVMEEVKFEHTRPLGKDHRFYEFGASMHTLGYHPLYVYGRFLKYLLTGKVTGRIGSLYMLYHYFKFTPKSNGYDSMYNKKFRTHVRKRQIERLRKLFF
jgi:glycosyltransferase involved in cell wall biosynthesis